MSDIHFLDYSYLGRGTAIQKQVYKALVDCDVMGVLSVFTPVLIGTYPIGIAVEGSDLDIACHFFNKSDFVRIASAHFEKEENFEVKESLISGVETVIIQFISGGFLIEIFAQPIPVLEQNGYRHMMIEWQILKERGEEFRCAVIALKESGIKTEPAFAKLLGLEGDPYQSLLIYGAAL